MIREKDSRFVDLVIRNMEFLFENGWRSVNHPWVFGLVALISLGVVMFASFQSSELGATAGPFTTDGLIEIILMVITFGPTLFVMFMGIPILVFGVLGLKREERLLLSRQGLAEHLAFALLLFGYNLSILTILVVCIRVYIFLAPFFGFEI